MPTLLLCMTPGVGLAVWEAAGTLGRELAPFEEYVRRGWRILIATYDRPSKAPRLPAGMEAVYCWRRRLQFLAPWFLRKAIRQADLVRTNQSVGGWWYVVAAHLHRRPILLRCGWLPGNNREMLNGLTWRLRLYRLFEGWGFRHADACQVSTEADRQWVAERYRVPLPKIHLRPNFVDGQRFAPLGVAAAPRSVVYVGRLDPVKRLDLVIRAAAIAKASCVTFVGEGPEQDHLAALAAEQGVRLVLAGRRPNHELPEIIQQSQIFTLASKAEGHPKALLEAMACGVACVGADAPGISSVIENGVTGLLCDSTPEALARAYAELFDDADRRAQLGACARQRMLDTLSYQAVMDKEIALADSVIAAYAARRSGVLPDSAAKPAASGSQSAF